MNVLSKDQYLFVGGENPDSGHPYGDMDRLKTSFNVSDTARGLIMPYRSNTEILSGEDVCYLNESARDRQQLVVDDEVQSVVFSRKISSRHDFATMFAATRDIRDICHMYIKDFPSFSELYSLVPLASGDIFGMYGINDLSSSIDEFRTGKKLIASKIADVYQDTKKLAHGLLFPRYETTVDEEYDSKSYSSEYPLDIDPQRSLHNEIFWDGGVTGGQSVPEHGFGGCAYHFNDILFDSNSNYPAGYSCSPLSVWVVYKYMYSHWTLTGGDEDVTGYLVKSYGAPIRVGGTLQYRMSANALFSVAKQIADDKFEWEYGELLDEFGERTLQLSVYRAYFVADIAHTKWW